MTAMLPARRTRVSRIRMVLVAAAAAIPLVAASCGGSPGQAVRAPATTTTTGNGASFAEIPELAERIQPSVVTIESQGGVGSGVVWSENGVIVTVAHVVGDAEQVTVVFADGRRVEGTVVATDDVTDLAVLRTDRQGLQPVSFRTEIPDLGELAIAIGSPFGFTSSVTAGVISGTFRTIPGSAPRTQALVDLIQTDAAVSPGNSGGALIDGHGEVVGIVEAFVPPSAGAVSIGFAIPSATVVDVVDELLEDGEVAHAFLGVVPQSVTRQVARQLELGQPGGALVLDVAGDGPAAAAGISAGDVVTQMADRQIDAAEDLIAELRDHEGGDEVDVTYVRDGEEHTTTVTLGTLSG